MSIKLIVFQLLQGSWLKWKYGIMQPFIPFCTQMMPLLEESKLNGRAEFRGSLSLDFQGTC